MSDLLKFMGEHTFLGFLMICSTYYILKYIIYCTPNRFLRHLNIRKAGWPPIHLDADGDFKPEEEQSP